MTLTPFTDLMAHADREQYAVGYFECWSLESLMAVADAADATGSPVMLGFSGIYLDHPHRERNEMLSVYSTMGREICQQLTVPCTLVFNESPHREGVIEAINQKFGLVMYSNEELSLPERISQIRQIVQIAHRVGIAVEGEAASLPGVSGLLPEKPVDYPLTEINLARKFVAETGIDAFAVNLGQVHLHGKQKVHLDLHLLSELHEALQVPLVLHGSTSVYQADISAAVKRGIRKINVGSALKQVYFAAMQEGCRSAPDDYNPYEIIGSGLREDVLVQGRIAMQRKVEAYMHLFGSAGKARSHS